MTLPTWDNIAPGRASACSRRRRPQGDARSHNDATGPDVAAPPGTAGLPAAAVLGAVPPSSSPTPTAGCATP